MNDGKLNKNQKVMKRLMEFIDKENYSEGDRLPSERKLAEIFEVSRSSIREAVRSLTTLRFLESKPSSGIYVKDINVDTSIDFVHLENSLGIEMNKDEIRDMLEIRYILEAYAVKRICLRVDEDKMKMLSEIANNQFFNPSPKINEQLDKKFHLGLAIASGNHSLVRLLNLLYDMSAERRLRFFNNYERVHRSFEEHRKILAALKERNLTNAEFYIKKHLDEAAKMWNVECKYL